MSGLGAAAAVTAVTAAGGVAALEAVAVARDYASGETVVHALAGVDLRVAPGELIAVRGRSGSGKTTMLNVLGGLDRPTSGHVAIDGRDLAGLSNGQLVELRRRTIGFIFQGFGLLPILSAAENVEIPLRLASTAPDVRQARVQEMLELVGLGGRAGHRPGELSGGEQQRVAIARALANRPRILLADEPTGQLDSETGHVIMGLIRQIVRAEHVTAIVATHDPAMLDVADRVVELRDGRLIEH
ncbi:MAG TPA: ABC transporter ATP-binding protein [Candidatus Limnocylindrales bacterium]|nr:ABC transporter ATP-binding protein [Candidatus Limnocylindrales bacterium]